MFEDSTFDSAGRIHTKSKTTVIISFVLESILLVVLAIIPLIFSEALPTRGLMTMLVAPPPPPPPPPAEAPKVRVIAKAPTPTQQMVQPRAIPRQIAMIEEAPSAVSAMVQGVAGMESFGAADLGGMINVVPPPPPPPPPVLAPIRVGGNVQEAKLVNRAQPAYPPLARQARVQGKVLLEAISNLTVTSGHPLLVQAAVDAVSRWVYQPTLLNGEPVEVITTIEVNFVMR